jgi:hypothetical protein
MTTIVGLALSIAGSVKAIPTNSASEISDGVTLRKVGTILLLVVYITNACIIASIIPRLHKIWDGDRKLFYAVTAALPFLAIRVIYSMCISFDSHSKTFNSFTPSVYAQAFMQIVMEFFVWALLLAAGLASPSMKDAPHTRHEVVNKQESVYMAMNSVIHNV